MAGKIFGFSEDSASTGWRKRKLYLLCISILPLMICSGMVYSILALYIVDDLGASRFHIGLIFMTGALAGALAAPMLGRLSDRVGRRPIMLLSMVGFMAAFSLYATAGSFIAVFPIQALEGATWAALGVTVPAYIADIAPARQRGWAMGIYERVWYMGWIVGPAFGGFLAQQAGFRITFLVGALLIVFGTVFMYLYVKEPWKEKQEGEGSTSAETKAEPLFKGLFDLEESV
ncbi:MFS transporter [Candidatus Hecatella orcuttiae]|jgi:MFS family permease|uniref:MFS transporter n=1 Tax=Candidatus Hecatella orcuttiae TaxID=1935119 RepID=UPI002867C4BD|nr:MFS transporter [Candidatus Hecatella orcuttiae]